MFRNFSHLKKLLLETKNLFNLRFEFALDAAQVNGRVSIHLFELLRVESFNLNDHQ